MVRARMSRLATASAFVCLTAPSSAQSVPIPTVSPFTILHLSAQATVPVAPDRLFAELLAQSTSASAATAQREVNGIMARAMTQAQGRSGVEARATTYSVGPTDERNTRWTAMQTLELEGQDGAAVLDLVGTLQAQGLSAASISWQISPALLAKTNDKATTKALQQLQERAEEAAATLRLRVDHIQDITLDSPVSPRYPMPMMAMARSRAAVPQQSATPQDVTATVSADVVLKP